MKDNEKQIEEMAKVIGNTWLVDLEGDTKDVCEVLDEVDIKGIARELYEKGYLKLPADSVVISKEELNKKYVSRDTYDAEIEYRKVLEKRVNKVTAEKIYLQAKAIVDATKHNRNFKIDDGNS